VRALRPARRTRSRRRRTRFQRIRRTPTSDLAPAGRRTQLVDAVEAFRRRQGLHPATPTRHQHGAGLHGSGAVVSIGKPGRLRSRQQPALYPATLPCDDNGPSPAPGISRNAPERTLHAGRLERTDRLSALRGARKRSASGRCVACRPRPAVGGATLTKHRPPRNHRGLRLVYSESGATARSRHPTALRPRPRSSPAARLPSDQRRPVARRPTRPTTPTVAAFLSWASASTSCYPYPGRSATTLT